MEDNLDKEIELADAASIIYRDENVRVLLESLAEGVIIINTKGQIVLINSRMSELFGYAAEEVIGEQLDIFIPQMQQPSHKEHIKRFFKKPRIRPMGNGLSLTGIRKDGQELPVEISLSFLQTDAGMLGLAFVTDISARKEMENELKEKNEALAAFAHTIAHDLNSTLAGLVGFSELLIDEPDLPREKQVKYLNEIAYSGWKMNKIIKEILLLSRIDKDRISRSEINTSEIVDNAIHRLRFKINEFNATINTENEYHAAWGYSPWIEEVWYNFISNAISYGGKPPIITIGSTMLDNNLIEFWVHDNGNGLSDEEMEIVFDKPENVKNQEYLGHGLGLKIVQRIINKLDGKLKVTSEKGVGSKFSFILPAM